MSAATEARQEILPNAVYLTNQAAALLQCRPSTIRAAVRTGQIRGLGRPYRAVRLLILVAMFGPPAWPQGILAQSPCSHQPGRRPIGTFRLPPRPMLG